MGQAIYDYVISCIQDSSNPQRYNISDGIPFVVSCKHVPLSHGSVSAIKYLNYGINDTIDYTQETRNTAEVGEAREIKNKQLQDKDNKHIRLATNTPLENSIQMCLFQVKERHCECGKMKYKLLCGQVNVEKNQNYVMKNVVM